MDFAKLLFQSRTEKGYSQQYVADKNHLVKQAIDNYEKKRRSCGFDPAVKILNSMGYEVIVKDKENISKKESVLFMENNLQFINFNSKDVKDEHKRKLEEEFINSLNDFSKAHNLLENQGFDIITNTNFSDKYSFSEYYSEMNVLTLEKDGITISLEVVGENEQNIFNLEYFLEVLKDKHGDDISKFVEKSILFSAYNGNGEEIYEAFDKKSKQLIVNIMPYLEPYADLVVDLLNEKLDTGFFFDLDYGYNPEEITIAYSLGIKDYFNSPSLIFSYEDEYGDKYYPAEYVEDEYIPNAMELAMIYFESANSPNWKETFEYKRH